ncbi:hypothetical protein D3C81_905820 [compost metagenome]
MCISDFDQLALTVFDTGFGLTQRVGNCRGQAIVVSGGLGVVRQGDSDDATQHVIGRSRPLRGLATVVGITGTCHTAQVVVFGVFDDDGGAVKALGLATDAPF